MKVMFYEISNCEYEFLDGNPAIIAPEGTNDIMLRKYRFIQLADGRWTHYMNKSEISHLMESTDDEVLIFNTPDGNYKSYANNKSGKKGYSRIIHNTLIMLLPWLGICLLSVNYYAAFAVMVFSSLLLLLRLTVSTCSRASRIVVDILTGIGLFIIPVTVLVFLLPLIGSILTEIAFFLIILLI